MKNAVKTKYSSHPLGKSPNAVLGLKYIIGNAMRTRIKPTKWVQMFPVSVCILYLKELKLKKIYLGRPPHKKEREI